MKVTLPWRTHPHRGEDPIPRAFRPWLILSLVVLVGSLFLLAVTVTAAFFAFGTGTAPLWVILVGAAAGLGIALGFLGFLLLMLAAGYKAWKESRRVQVLPPE